MNARRQASFDPARHGESGRRQSRTTASPWLAMLACAALFAAIGTARADVILHAFNWPYPEVEARADQIQSAGYAAVLVSPPLRSQGDAWWARYQPQDYRVIDNPLGDTQDFVAMSAALQARGIRVYADIVINHMANEAGIRDDLSYPGQAVLDAYAADPDYYEAQRLFGDLSSNFLGAADFGPAQCITDYGSVFQVQTWRLCGGPGDAGLPDLVANSWVVTQQRQYLATLKGLGVTGFRVDAAKHMPLAHINAVFTPDIRAGTHVFGEIITSGGAGNAEYQNFLVPYLEGTDHGAYDFPLFESIRRALGLGGSMSELVDPAAFGQALAPSRAITFAVTHDIPNNAGFRYLILDPVDEALAYAYLLGRDGGVPLLYSDNDESGDGRWQGKFDRPDLVAMIGFHNAVQGSDMAVLAHGSCHLLFRRGSQGIVGINKCATPVEVDVGMDGSVLWWFADYTDVLGSGSVVNIGGSSHRFVLPPRQARMWLR